LPVKEILSSDAGGRCLQSDDCCSGFREHNPFCYRAQCRETAEQLAQRLGLAGDRWSVSFQSRVGRRWLEPYTDKEVVRLAQEGKHLVVVAPSFVAENLETLAELDDELRRLFIRSGGRTFHRVPQLNGFEPWVRGSVRLLESRLQL
jgi:ferrochelatase